MLKAAITLLAVHANKSLVPVGLDSIQYDIEVFGGIAQVKLRVNYFNNLDQAVNTVFKFPVSDKAVFSGLEATFRDKTVKGVAKEKVTAKKEF